MDDAERRVLVNRLIDQADLVLVSPDQFKKDYLCAPEEWERVKRCAENIVNGRDMYDGIEMEDPGGEVPSPVQGESDKPAGEGGGKNLGKDRVQRGNRGAKNARKVSRGVRT